MRALACPSSCFSVLLPILTTRDTREKYMKYTLPAEKIFKLQDYFIRHNFTLSVSESCTAGLLSCWLTSQPGASKYFLAGVVAYQNLIKQKFLKVDPELLASEGAVCEKVALQMAQGIKNQTHSTWALSTTGLAGPDQGRPNRGHESAPVGTLCMAVVGPSTQQSKCLQIKNLNRQNFQHKACTEALNLLLRAALGDK